MSKTTEAKEIFTVYRQNIDKYFTEVEKVAPQYLQSITNIQQEFTATWKNAIESTISLQQEFTTKIGMNTNVPAIMIKIINDTTEELIKARTVQNKIVLAAMDTLHQNIKTFNNNAKAFAGLNGNILQSWISICTPTRN